MTIIGTGLFAGILDGVAAELLYFISGGKNPSIVFQYIASGVFGKEAFSGGTLMVVLGVAFHLFIASSWTFIFFLVYPRLPVLSRKKILGGIVYGLALWLAMNLVVLPLSHVRQLPFDAMRALTGIVVLMVAVGLPVSLSAHRFFSKKK
jgi:hypothetical protein